MEHARTVTRREAVIAYRVRHAAQKAPRRALILLHGLASNLTRWSEFVEHTTLAQRWDVIRVDLRGHGDSPTPGPISVERWCDDLTAILDQEQHADAVLIGHSLGAQIALHFAGRYPQRTHALALIDPVFRAALHGPWKLLAQLGPAFHLAAVIVRGLNAIGLRRREIPELDLRALDEKARQALKSERDTEAFVRRYSSTRADLRTFRTAHYLQELVEMFRPVPEPESISVPVLLLLSAGGTFADPRQSTGIAARFPHARIITIDCQHWPLTERPGEVRQAIEAWIDSIVARE
jgi:pimeloyl-ACP methyl ester carboxylesterase